MAPVSTNSLMLIPIIMPFMVALIIFGFRKYFKNFAGEIAAGSLIIVIAIISALTHQVTNATSRIIYGFYNTTSGMEYSAPYGVQFRADSFTGWFLIIINVVIMLVLIFEATKQRGKDQGPIYIALLMFLVSGINGVALANDYFTLVFAWIIIGITMILLITFKRRTLDLREGGMRSYILIGLAIVFLLAAAVLSFGLFGSANFDFVNNNTALLTSQRIEDAKYIIYLIMAFTIVGFGLFANLFLLNHWMPKAIEKTTASTQMFSTGLISGLALLSIFRVLYSFFDPGQFAWMGNYSIILTAIGFITAFEGALLLFYHVMRKDKQKITLSKVIIYAIIANIGIILIGLSVGGLATGESVETLFTLKECIGYSTMQIFNIAITSYLAFAAKDRMMLKRQNSEKLLDLRGIGKEYPITSFILVIGLSSMVGLLPTFGGVNIYMLLFSLIQLDYLFFAITIIIIVILMLVSYLRILKYLLFDKSTQDTSFITGGMSGDFSLDNFIGIVLALGLLVLGIVPKIIGLRIIEHADLLFL